MARGDGARRFKALMALLPRELKKTIDAELVKQAQQLVATQKAKAPRQSGALRESIRAERTAGRELSVTVRAGGPKTTKPVRQGQKATYDYAIGVEHGNRHAPEQPFFYPGYRQRKRAIRQGVGKAVKATIQAAAKR